MDDEIFIGDLSEQVGNLTTVNTLNQKYEKYEIEEICGYKFIVGKGKPINFIDKGNGNGFYSIEEEFDEFQLLFSLIRLIKGSLPNFFGNPHALDDVITDNDVLEWVKTYGIPYHDHNINKLLKDPKIKLQYLSLENIELNFSFKYYIAELYENFSIWKTLIEGDLQKIEKEKWKLDGFEENNKLTKNLIDYDKLDTFKDALADIINLHTGVNIILHYDQKFKKYKLMLKSSNLLDIAYYQLAVLMTKPDTDIKMYLKKCNQCQNLFWAKHKNREYCYYGCNRQTHNSRKRRANK